MSSHGKMCDNLKGFLFYNIGCCIFMPFQGTKVACMRLRTMVVQRQNKDICCDNLFMGGCNIPVYISVLGVEMTAEINLSLRYLGHMSLMLDLSPLQKVIVGHLMHQPWKYMVMNCDLKGVVHRRGYHVLL